MNIWKTDWRAVRLVAEGSANHCCRIAMVHLLDECLKTTAASDDALHALSPWFVASCSGVTMNVAASTVAPFARRIGLCPDDKIAW